MIRSRLAVSFVFFLAAQPVFAANPLQLISETYAEWKERLFGSSHAEPAVVDAAAHGPIALQVAHPLKLHIDSDAPQREFEKGNSRYRVIELPIELEHAAVRLQVLTERNKGGHGNAVFKPLLYVLGEGDSVGKAVEAKPLYLDIRPFRRTRLLGCVKLDKVHRFAIATAADAVGTFYESGVRDAVTAPTQRGFYYTTDAVKVKLPYVSTGTLIIDVIPESTDSKGC
ncbi:MAG: hypothetical protein ABIW82_08285 [Dokdonella sp.]